MKQSLFLLALAGALSGLACGPSTLLENDPSAETQREAIIGGTAAPGDPAVVSIAVRYGPSYESVCTGTLIAPKTVLTAAHCIYAYGTNVQYFVAFGSNSSSPTRAVQVAQQYKNPNYDQATNDFGLLRLATPVVDVTPIELNETPMTNAFLGKPIRHVGYGLTVANSQQSGIKRQVTYNVRQITPWTIESGAAGKQTCQGDSGGPGFMTIDGSSVEKIVGVVSYGDQNCAIEGYDGRVDKVVPWIRTTMAGWETPTCATDGRCVMGCTPIDQDCACLADGVCGGDCLDPSSDVDCPKDCAANGICSIAACGRPDVDCVAEGSRCEAVTQCRDRLCLNDAQNPVKYCSKFCSTSSECPSNMECVNASCLMKQRPVRQLFDSCSASSDFCSQSICTGPAGGISRCVSSCLVTNDCPTGSVCEAGADSRKYCRPAGLKFNFITLPAVTSVQAPAASGCSASGGALALWLGATLLRRRRR